MHPRSSSSHVVHVIRFIVGGGVVLALLAMPPTARAGLASAKGAAQAKVRPTVKIGPAFKARVNPVRTITPLLGGQTLGLDHGQAVRVEMGWPSLRMTYVLPFTQTLDISPQFTLRYGRDLRVGFVGFEPGMEIRWSFWHKANWSLALYADPALLLWIPSNGVSGQLGVRIGGPGLLVGWRVASFIAVDFGLRLPMRLMIKPRVTFSVPVLGRIGTEVRIVQTKALAVQLEGFFEIGPDICAGRCKHVNLDARVALGSAILW